MRLTREQWAKVGILVQLLALVRTLGEIYRLKYVFGGELTLDQVEPFVTGALLDALLICLAVLLFFFHRYTSATVVAVATVFVLMIYKLYAIG